MPLEREVKGGHEKIENFVSKGPLPYRITTFEKAVRYLNPFLKYVFDLKPAIPNLIYMVISVIGMQLLNIKDLLPNDVEWMQPVLFWGLFASIGIQVLFASAKSISIPVLTVSAAGFCIWLQVTQGVVMPISKEVFQYLACLGIFGLVVSSVCNH